MHYNNSVHIKKIDLDHSYTIHHVILPRLVTTLIGHQGYSEKWRFPKLSLRQTEFLGQQISIVIEKLMVGKEQYKVDWCTGVIEINVSPALEETLLHIEQVRAEGLQSLQIPPRKRQPSFLSQVRTVVNSRRK